MKKDEILNEEKSNLTIIRLLGLRSKNKLNTPKKLTTIARNILNHCFIYFVLNIAPRIVIKDDEESILINDLYNNIGKENISSQEFKVEKHSFKLVHFRNYNPNSNSHCLNLCANERRVSSISLQNVISGINSKFRSKKGLFVYNGYITSKFLDEKVNKERTAFDIEDEQRNLFGDVTKHDIIAEATKLILSYQILNCIMKIRKKKSNIMFLSLIHI